MNLHASLLPRHRGASPINAAILAGDTHTGLSVISLAQKMDAGLVYHMVSTPIDPGETAGELHDRLADMGPGAIDPVLHDLEHGALQGQVQDESLVTLAPKLSKADGTVSFDGSAEAVRRRVHGLTPWPGVRVMVQPADGGERWELLLRRVAVAAESGDAGGSEPGLVQDGGRVLCGQGAVQLLELQRPGARALDWEQFRPGGGLHTGDRLLPWPASGLRSS